MKNLRFPIAGPLIGAGVFLSLMSGAVSAQVENPITAKETKHHKEAADFFAGPIVRLKIDLSSEQYSKLRKDERNYAEATLTEFTLAGEKVAVHKVAVKLKGHGSFEHLNGKPSLTLNFDKGEGGKRFHGMKKIHLNNSRQDPTYLSELIAGEMARKAGVPASRCTHAFVELNGRDVGIYVLKEGFTKDFIATFYKNPTGNLYDGDYVKDIHENLKTMNGDPKDKTALKELIAASKEADPAKRWERLGKILDIEKFITFSAMEVIMCHWDGYNSFNHNNYRLYLDPDTGKFSFFMHGMDTCFGDENYTLAHNFIPPRGSIVGGAIMRCPQGPPMYWAKLKSIHENVLLKEDWAGRIMVVGTRLSDAIALKDPKKATAYEGTVKQASLRIPRRIAVVGRQLEQPVKPIFVEKAGVKVPKNWGFDDSNGGKGDQVKFEGRNCLHLVADGKSAPSWRLKMNLQPGRYRVHAIVGVRGVEATEDEFGRGAGFRITDAPKRANVLEGDGGFHPGSAGGQTTSYEFETSGGEVELIFELRATRGEAWFARDTFGIVRGQ